MGIKVIIDEMNLDKILKVLPEEQITKINKDFGEINLIYSKESIKTPGPTSIVLNELSSNGVNLEEIITCVPEVTFIIHEKDFIIASKLIYDLLKEL